MINNKVFILISIAQNKHCVKPNVDFDVYCLQPNMVYNQRFILMFFVYHNHDLQQPVHFDVDRLQQAWSTTKCWIWWLLFTTNMVHNQRLIPIICLISFGIILYQFMMVDSLSPIICLNSFGIIIFQFVIVDIRFPIICWSVLVSFLINLWWWIYCVLSFVWSVLVSFFINSWWWIYCFLSFLWLVLVSFRFNLWLWIYCFQSFVLISFGIISHWFMIVALLFSYHVIFTTNCSFWYSLFTNMSNHSATCVLHVSALYFGACLHHLRRSRKTNKMIKWVQITTARMFKVSVDLSVGVSVDFRAMCKNRTVNKKHGL